jgi:hypothetical protein
MKHGAIGEGEGAVLKLGGCPRLLHNILIIVVAAKHGQ